MEWKKDIVQWTWDKTLFLSVPFTWLIPKTEQIASQHKGKVIVGGPAIDLVGWNGKGIHNAYVPFDVLSMHNPLATFTTRGCIRKCPFCAVPKTEGDFIQLDTWKPAPIVCDNNLLAANYKHLQKVVNSLKGFSYVDFNQGLDARLFNEKHAKILSELHHVKIRFSFDNTKDKDDIYRAVMLSRHYRMNDIGIYVLIGYNDTPVDAIERLEIVRGWGALPNPMRYQPLDTLEKNSYVAPGWTDHELKRVMRYYSRLNYLGHIAFDDYKYAKDDIPLFDRSQAHPGAERT